MAAKDENLLVKLVKKSVGLSTEACGCGTVPAADARQSSAAETCCATQAVEVPAADCCEKKAQAQDTKPAAGA